MQCEILANRPYVIGPGAQKAHGPPIVDVARRVRSVQLATCSMQLCVKSASRAPSWKRRRFVLGTVNP